MLTITLPDGNNLKFSKAVSGLEVAEKISKSLAKQAMVISIDDFVAMADGSLDGVSAFMTGRLKVQGDMGIAMKLGAILT